MFHWHVFYFIFIPFDSRPLLSNIRDISIGTSVVRVKKVSTIFTFISLMQKQEEKEDSYSYDGCIQTTTIHSHIMLITFETRQIKSITVKSMDKYRLFRLFCVKCFNWLGQKIGRKLNLIPACFSWVTGIGTVDCVNNCQILTFQCNRNSHANNTFQVKFLLSCLCMTFPNTIFFFNTHNYFCY